TDYPAPIAAMHHISVETQRIAHQARPKTGNFARRNRSFRRIGKAAAWQAWNYDSKSILHSSTITLRMSKPVGHIDQFDRRTRPAMGHDDRHRIFARTPF